MRHLTMIDGLQIEELEHIKTLLKKEYYRAISGDDAADLQIALEMLTRVISRDRSQSRHDYTCSCAECMFARNTA